MKAIRVHEFGDPAVLQLADLPDAVPGPGQFVVRIHAAGVNPVETYIRAGQYAKLPSLPYTPGTDGAGVIDRVGADADGWHVGQRVYLAGAVSGTYAVQALCEASHLHPLPERVSFAQGAALGVPYATAHLALFHRGEAAAGESVLVHGATGGVGLATVQFARAAGLTVLATGGSEPGRALLREEGAHHVFDHHAADCAGQILEATKGRGVDLIVEMLANANLARDLTLLASGGRVLVVGSRGPVEINPRDLMARQGDIRGVMLFGTPPAVIACAHEAIVAGLEGGTLRPIIARELPLLEAPQAHAAILRGGAAGKIVLIPPSDD